MFLLYLLLFVLSAAYLLLKYRFTYWHRKGFPYIEPSMPFGNISGAAMRKQSVGMNLYDLYRKTNEGIVGVYMLFRPALLVRDANLVKTILTTDFAHFHDRGVYHADPKHDTLALNIFSMKGQMWKSMRTKLTPAFTTGKLKGWMPTIIDISDNLVRKLEPMAENGEIVEMKDLMTRWVHRRQPKSIRLIDAVENCDYSILFDFVFNSIFFSFHFHHRHRRHRLPVQICNGYCWNSLLWFRREYPWWWRQYVPHDWENSEQRRICQLNSYGGHISLPRVSFNHFKTNIFLSYRFRFFVCLMQRFQFTVWASFLSFPRFSGGKDILWFRWFHGPLNIIIMYAQCSCSSIDCGKRSHNLSLIQNEFLFFYIRTGN